MAASRTRAPTGRRRRIFVAAVFGAVTLTAMSVPAAVGSVSGEAVALTNSSDTLSNAALASTVSDNFDRADGALGSNWTTVSGTAAPRIVSDNLRAGTASALNSAYWSASTFGNDQFAQATLPDSSGTQYGPGIAVRLSSTKGYFLWYGNSPDTVSLWRMGSSSSWTQLKQSGPLTVARSTDVWGIQAVGSTVSGYQNGKLVVQATDTDIKSGSPGVWLYNSSNQIDNWSGGDAATHSVGGGSDNFNRPDGPLGANWTGISDGGLTISAQAAAGTMPQISVATYGRLKATAAISTHKSK